MTTSEPTTGEIVEVLRENGDVYFGETEITCEQIADRLESQEQKIAELTEQIADKNDEIEMARDGIEDTVKAMTARAEQAERERDAAIKELTDYEDALYPTVEDMMRDLNTL